MSASAPTSALRRIERWIVGVVMAVMVFVLERLVMRQIERKQRSAADPAPGALTVGEE